MADTRVQMTTERWIVDKVLPVKVGLKFTKRKLPLKWGGHFEFDAVSEDGAVAACVSTSCCKTATGRNAIGKFHKIRSDALYLLSATGVSKRLLVFTDSGMLAHFEQERTRGRFPPASEIELVLADLPPHIAASLTLAAKTASSEVLPH